MRETPLQNKLPRVPLAKQGRVTQQRSGTSACRKTSQEEFMEAEDLCLQSATWVDLLSLSLSPRAPTSAPRPPTGKPDAGNPPVRFGGRGAGNRSPYPYPIQLNHSGLQAVIDRSALLCERMHMGVRRNSHSNSRLHPTSSQLRRWVTFDFRLCVYVGGCWIPGIDGVHRALVLFLHKGKGLVFCLFLRHHKIFQRFPGLRQSNGQKCICAHPISTRWEGSGPTKNSVSRSKAV